MVHNNPVPAAIALVRVRRKDGSLALLGVIRKRSPVDGRALPGGYVDAMETACTAAARELWEETRIVTNASQWRLFEDRISAENRLLLFCELTFEIREDVLHRFIPTKEVAAVLCLTSETPICFPNHQAVVRGYLATEATQSYPELSAEVDMSHKL